MSVTLVSPKHSDRVVKTFIKRLEKLSVNVSEVKTNGSMITCVLTSAEKLDLQLIKTIIIRGGATLKVTPIRQNMLSDVYRDYPGLYELQIEKHQYISQEAALVLPDSSGPSSMINGLPGFLNRYRYYPGMMKTQIPTNRNVAGARVYQPHFLPALYLSDVAVEPLDLTPFIESTSIDTLDPIRPHVYAKLGGEGIQIWENFTEQNISKFVRILVNDSVASNPAVNSAIPNGIVPISGEHENKRWLVNIHAVLGTDVIPDGIIRNVKFHEVKQPGR